VSQPITRTITKRQPKNDIIPLGQTLAHCSLKNGVFLGAPFGFQDEQQAQDMGGFRCFLNELLELKEEDVKTKLSSAVVVVIVEW